MRLTEKITFSQMEKLMREYNKRKIKALAYIVFKENNWEKKYSLASRTYQVFSNAKYFDIFANGTSLPGYALDGTDDGVDLRCQNWEIDYCYMSIINPPLT